MRCLRLSGRAVSLAAVLVGGLAVSDCMLEPEPPTDVSYAECEFTHYGSATDALSQAAAKSRPATCDGTAMPTEPAAWPSVAEDLQALFALEEDALNALNADAICAGAPPLDALAALPATPGTVDAGGAGTPAVVDALGVVQSSIGRRLLYHPTTIGRFVNDQQRRLRRGATVDDLTLLRANADWLLDNLRIDAGIGSWWLEFDHRGHDATPWNSAMTNGIGLSALWAGALATPGRCADYVDAMRAVLGSFFVPVTAGGVLSAGADGGPWLEEHAQDNSHILNGMIFALYDLATLGQRTGSDAMRRVFQILARSVARNLSDYDCGFVSHYSLGAEPVFAASRYYHSTHVLQLLWLYHTSCAPTFWEWAWRWNNVELMQPDVGLTCDSEASVDVEQLCNGVGFWGRSVARAPVTITQHLSASRRTVGLLGYLERGPREPTSIRVVGTADGVNAFTWATLDLRDDDALTSLGVNVTPSGDESTLFSVYFDEPADVGRIEWTLANPRGNPDVGVRELAPIVDRAPELVEVYERERKARFVY